MDGWGSARPPPAGPSIPLVPPTHSAGSVKQGDRLMALQQAWRWILGGSGRRRQARRWKAKAARPRLEALEDRLVPANWFVSTLGVDDAAHGSPGAPFRSIQFAINQAASGDRIHVAQGLYGY